MKKLLSLLSSVLLISGSVATVVACGIRIDPQDEKKDISRIQITDVKVGDQEQHVLSKIGTKIKTLYSQAEINGDYVIEGLELLVTNKTIEQEGAISVVAIGDHLVGGFILEIRENDSTTTPLPPNPTNPGPNHHKEDISKILITNVFNNTNIDQVKKIVSEAINKKAQGAIFGLDYTISGNPQKNRIITVKATSLSKWIKGAFTINVKKSDKEDISKVQINDIKVKDSKQIVLNRIQTEISRFYSEAQINTDYTIDGLDNLVQGGVVVDQGSVNVAAKGEHLTGGFVLWIRESNSTTEPIGPNPPSPTKLQDISDIQIIGVLNTTTISEVEEKVAEKIIKKSPNAKLNIDYKIDGNPQENTIIMVQATTTSKLIKNSFTIQVEKVEIGTDIKDIEQELKKILNPQIIDPSQIMNHSWDKTELQKKVQEKYEGVTVEMLPKTQLNNFESHLDNWKFVGNRETNNQLPYYGSINIEHQWSADKTENVSVIYDWLREQIGKKDSDFWSANDLQDKINNQYGKDQITISHTGDNTDLHVREFKVIGNAQNNENAKYSGEIRAFQVLDRNNQSKTIYFDEKVKSIKAKQGSAPEGTKEVIHIGWDDLKKGYQMPQTILRVPNYISTQIIDLSNMFRLTKEFNDNINSWNTGNVENMEKMFNIAYEFNQNLNNWNTKNVKKMVGMFADARKFNGPIGNWNTENVENMAEMFQNAEVFNQDISTKLLPNGIKVWDTSKVTDMHQMFENANSYRNDLSEWNVSGVTNAITFTNVEEWKWQLRPRFTIKSVFGDGATVLPNFSKKPNKEDLIKVLLYLYRENGLIRESFEIANISYGQPSGTPDVKGGIAYIVGVDMYIGEHEVIFNYRIK
ncbi:BspA family leucine-rich repeat surface protein [Williamsoniiplasma lucivorax]|uniref:Lipoprotein n=1 Tax=Williamsoniiplasma lucivorax TaxID=209274 RepID=A0A2S5RES6_9MOLU|nr:BspA family leucine-rich repeat surface protein [Williamsoniiplasma lucivorax]PPE05823.1 hypothetical protein ELUCI_v1c01110 [Williamsoniiplasma lucivorax]